jgi:LPXTG-motif cell wall-anchored protein
VSYNENDPNLNRLGDPDTNYIGPILMGVGILLVIGGVFISSRKRKLKNKLMEPPTKKITL